MANILVLNYRLEVHTRTIYQMLADRGHEIWHFPLMEMMDPGAPGVNSPRFHAMRPLCRQPIVHRSGVLGEQVFFTWDLSAVGGLLRLRARVDLVLCHGLFVIPTPALLAAAKLLSVPFVTQICCRPSQYEQERSLAIRSLRRIYLCACDAVLAAGDVEALRDYGVPEHRIHRFDPFIDFMADQGPVERAELDGGRCRPVRLGFVGQLFYLKGLLELLEAYGELRKRHQHLELILIGGSPPESGGASCERELRGRIAEGNIKGVTITGWQPRQAVQQLLKSVDVFVFPSHSDTYGKAVMEAMAMGIPVAISDACGSVGPLAVDGETALVFRARDVRGMCETVGRLIEDPSLRVRLGAAGRARVASHTAERTCGVYEEVIRMFARRGQLHEAAYRGQRP